MTYLWFALCRVLYRNLVIVQHDLLEISRLQICGAYQQNDPNCSLQSDLERNQRGWNYNPSYGKYALEIDGSLRSSSPQLKSPHQKKRFHCSAPTVSQRTAWCNKHLLPMPKGIFCYRRGFPPTSVGFDMFFSAWRWRTYPFGWVRHD